MQEELGDTGHHSGSALTFIPLYRIHRQNELQDKCLAVTAAETAIWSHLRQKLKQYLG